MRTRRVTISDVAAEAGVSVATVSKVLNDRYGVAAATSQRVRGVIDQLGYASSLGARSLRSATTHVLGVLVTHIEPFSAEFLKGASNAIAGTGYELVIYVGGDHERQSGWERQYVSRLSGTLADGLILVTPASADFESSAPLVAVDPHTGPTSTATVVSDNLAGARLATEHLIELGHRRIACLTGRADLESARLREAGFRAAMADAGLEVDESLVRAGSYLAEVAIQPARELLDRPDHPTAVFAANDQSAIATMQVARELGLDVPHDVSVVGFDNIPESALATPPLTTIDQSINQMGVEAVHMLLRLVAGEEVAQHVTLPTMLVRRHSTAAPA